MHIRTYIIVTYNNIWWQQLSVSQSGRLRSWIRGHGTVPTYPAQGTHTYGPGKIRTYMPRYTVEYSSRYGRYRYTDAL